MSEMELNTGADKPAKEFQSEILDFKLSPTDAAGTIADVIALAVADGLPDLECKATGETVPAMESDICSYKVTRLPCGASYLADPTDVTTAQEVGTDDTAFIGGVSVDTAKDDFGTIDPTREIVRGADACLLLCFKLARSLTAAQVASLTPGFTLIPGGFGPETGGLGSPITAINAANHFDDPDGNITGYTMVGGPIGLAINPTTGIISGTPFTSGTFNIVVTATDGTTSIDCPFTLEVVVEEDMAINLTVNNPNPDPGDTVIFSLQASNNDDGATNVVVNFPLPAGLTYVSSSPGGYDPLTGVWNRGTYGAVNTEFLQVNATVDSVTTTTTIIATATIDADEVDPNLTNNTSSTSLEVKVYGPPEPITGLTGTLSDGTTYTVTNFTGDPTLFDSAGDGDIRWEQNSEIQFAFSAPVRFNATPTDGGDGGTPIVWQLPTNGASTRLVTDGDGPVYEPGTFDAQIDISTPGFAQATLPNSGSPDADDPWGIVYTENASTVVVRGAANESMRFTAQVCV